jgi:diguanylate cyclase (GGDEF)-like protein
MGWFASARRAVSWIAPEGVLLGAAVVSLRSASLRASVLEVAPFYPYVVFGSGLLLAFRFQRSRLVFALLALALTAWALARPAAGSAASIAFQASAALLPMNLAAIALMTERGTFTRAGLLRLSALVFQVLAVVLSMRFAPERIAALFGLRLLPAAWFAWTPLAQIPVLAFAAAAAVTAAGALFQASAASRAFLWVLAASFLGFQGPRAGVAGTVYLATGGLILVVTVIEASHVMAYQDGLTGLPARRAFNEALQQLGGTYTVGMVDVDHFKKLNDRYGHDVGDQVLKMVAARLAKAPGGGRAFRYGGEEFALLFTGRTVAECLPDLEALRQDIEGSRFTIRRRLRPRRRPAAPRIGPGNPRRVAITVSIGAAESNGRHKTPDRVIRAADQALYQAKESGRNRVRS